MASRDDRIASLVATLKNSGIAKSDAQARMMAEEMIGVEESVQKRYDEEHSKAHEFLKTAKHLGIPRVRKAKAKEEDQVEEKPASKPENRIAPIPKIKVEPASVPEPDAKPEPVDIPKPKVEAKSVPAAEPEVKSEPVDIPEPKVEVETDSPGEPEPVETPEKDEPTDNFPKYVPGKIKPENVKPEHTDVNFGSGSLQDLMMNQIKSDHHEIRPIEDMIPKEPVKPPVRERQEEKEELKPIEVEEEIGEAEEIVKKPIKMPVVPVEEPSESAGEIKKSPVQEILREVDEIVGTSNTPDVEVTEEPETVKAPVEPAPVSEDMDSETAEGEIQEETVADTVPEEASQLDSEKLQEMMEEDGPMEETTREIKEKPKETKPKEDFPENSVDLSEVFNANK